MIRTNLALRSLLCLIGALAIFAKTGVSQNFELVSPLDSIVTSEPEVNCIWNSLDGSDSYRFQVSQDPDFNTITLDSLTDQTSTLLALQSNSAMYWRVIRVESGIEIDTTFTRSIYQIDLNSLSNVFFHFNADSGVSVVSNSVDLWEDEVNGLQIQQSDPDKRPLFLPNETSLNDHNALSFDGDNDYIFSSDFDLLQPCNYFLIFKEGQLGGNYMDGSNGFVKHLLRYQGLKYGFTSGSGSVKTTTDIDTALYAIVNIEVESSISTIFLNGINENTNGTGNRSSEGLTLGAFGTGTGNMKMILPEIIAFDTVITDSLRNKVTDYLFNKYSPPVDLGPDIYSSDFCPKTIDPGKRFRSYAWSDGSDADTLIAEESGIYHITVTDIFGRISSDTIYVKFPVIDQIDPDTICEGQSLIWYSGLNNSDFDFIWNDLSTDSLLTISEEDNYWLEVTDNTGCTNVSDTIFIGIDEFGSSASLGPDLDLCAGNSLELVSGASEATEYLWMDTDDGPTFEVLSSGTYWVEAQNALGCIAQDTIDVNIIGQAPIANFSASEFCFGDDVEFTDLSVPPGGESIGSWSWDFGDTNTSMTPEPIHAYDSVATYVVSLTVETVAGCSDDITIPVVINPVPEANFNISNLCAEQDAFFSDNSTISSGSITAWSWDFGDTGGASGEEVTHSYEEAGTYTVNYTITTDASCTNSISQEININPSPVSEFEVTETCFGQPTVFSQNVDTIASGPIQNYTWDFGNGFSSNFPTTSQTYFVPGNYNVTLSVTSFFGCADDSTQNISINDFPEVGFENMIACIGEQTLFMDTSIMFMNDSLIEWNWNFGNLGVSSEQNAVHTFNETGNFIVSLDVTSQAGCTASTQTTITVFEDPNPEFSFEPSIGLPPLDVTFENLTPDAIQYNWIFGDGGTSTDIAPEYTYLDTGIFTIQLLATNQNGCSEVISKSILVIEPIFELALSDLQCEIIDNRLVAEAFIQNFGNHDITSMNLSLNIGNGARISEQWTGSLKPGENTFYQFVGHPEIDQTLNHSYFCSTVSDPNGNNKELSDGNNTMCKSLDDTSLQLFPPFPNPNEGILYFNFIMPINEVASIQIFDAIGRSVLSKEINAEKGINTEVLYIPEIEAGSYILRVSFSNNEQSQLFFVK
ncbi:MAG: PKD domain-containing protein [Flavobacteriales bacterium]|nr:PKD domain-containing protein [Flavobacteriales bacterium]